MPHSDQLWAENVYFGDVFQAMRPPRVIWADARMGVTPLHGRLLQLLARDQVLVAFLAHD